MYLTPRWRVPFDVTEKFDFKTKVVTKENGVVSISNRDDDDLCNSKLLQEKKYEGDQNDREYSKENRKSFLKLVFNMLFVLNVFYFGVLVIRWNYFISSFNAWMTHSATIIFNKTTENTSDEPCHDSQNVTNMVSKYT